MSCLFDLHSPGSLITFRDCDCDWWWDWLQLVSIFTRWELEEQFLNLQRETSVKIGLQLFFHNHWPNWFNWCYSRTFGMIATEMCTHCVMRLSLQSPDQSTQLTLWLMPCHHFLCNLYWNPCILSNSKFFVISGYASKTEAFLPGYKVLTIKPLYLSYLYFINSQLHTSAIA